MKLKHIIVLSISLLTTSIKAQDLIVTSEGDSLNCKITKVKTDNIYFTFNHKGEIRSTLLPFNQVKYHQYNYYQTAVVPESKVIGSEIYPHFRAAVNGGWSYRLASLPNNIPSELEEYVKELKSGYHFGVELSYYFTEQVGLGFMYSNYRSENQMDNVTVTQTNGPTLHGKMSDDISIDFIGPFFSSRLLSGDKKNGLVVNLGIGYLGYTDKAVLISDFTIKGNTVGLYSSIGYDIGLSENFALGFQLAYTIGALREYELSYGVNTKTVKLDRNNYENLSRIDLSIGLRFIK